MKKKKYLRTLKSSICYSCTEKTSGKVWELWEMKSLDNFSKELYVIQELGVAEPQSF